MVTVEFDAIDIGITTTVAAAANPGIGTTSRLYLLNQKNSKVPPVSVLDGYRFGANNSEELKVNLSISGVTTAYSARVIMDGTEDTSLKESGEKVTRVARTSVGINSISTSIFTLEEDHNQQVKHQ